MSENKIEKVTKEQREVQDQGGCKLDKSESVIEKVTKEQDVKYKTKKAAGMNKTVFLLFWSTSKRFRMSENDIPAVLEYLKKIEHE